MHVESIEFGINQYKISFGHKLNNVNPRFDFDAWSLLKPTTTTLVEATTTLVKMNMPEETEETTTAAVNVNDRKVSWGRLRRVDSLNLEAGKLSFNSAHNQVQVISSFVWEKLSFDALCSIMLLVLILATSALVISLFVHFRSHCYENR